MNMKANPNSALGDFYKILVEALSCITPSVQSSFKSENRKGLLLQVKGKKKNC
jgi:hypothetical protein